MRSCASIVVRSFPDVSHSALTLAEFRSGDVMTTFLDSFEYVCPCIEVIESGLATSVQDGIPRVKGDGIPYGGPFDTLAARAANVLAGNEEIVEVLECTMV